MKPLQLRLKGFTGIRDGLRREELSLDFEALAGGAELVAIAGPNGTGKSTVMDCLVPYRVMPSRAGADSIGTCSFYDHVYLPESEKDLTWEHAGNCYRSQLVFRLNGRKKTDAYLHVWRKATRHTRSSTKMPCAPARSKVRPSLGVSSRRQPTDLGRWKLTYSGAFVTPCCAARDRAAPSFWRTTGSRRRRLGLFGAVHT
jgi:energy-coupling factor transporter ATP-binding protein EcfA2